MFSDLFIYLYCKVRDILILNERKKFNSNILLDHYLKKNCRIVAAFNGLIPCFEVKGSTYWTVRVFFFFLVELKKRLKPPLI